MASSDIRVHIIGVRIHANLPAFPIMAELLWVNVGSKPFRIRIEGCRNCLDSVE